jgi:hypothetical protein
MAGASFFGLSLGCYCGIPLPLDWANRFSTILLNESARMLE